MLGSVQHPCKCTRKSHEELERQKEVAPSSDQDLRSNAGRVVQAEVVARLVMSSTPICSISPRVPLVQGAQEVRTAVSMFAWYRAHSALRAARGGWGWRSGGRVHIHRDIAPANLVSAIGVLSSEAHVICTKHMTPSQG